MAEMSDKEIEAHRKNLQSVYWAIQGGRSFEMRTDSAHAQAIIWAINRIGQLELENESLRETAVTLSAPPMRTSPETDEEIHQRRRRERMLDEVTLICMQDRIEQLIDANGKQTESGATTERRWGRNSRDTADQICRGINEYDAAH